MIIHKEEEEENPLDHRLEVLTLEKVLGAQP
jgi:hypothetical protein